MLASKNLVRHAPVRSVVHVIHNDHDSKICLDCRRPADGANLIATVRRAYRGKEQLSAFMRFAAGNVDFAAFVLDILRQRLIFERVSH